jgi:hypothetical protein
MRKMNPSQEFPIPVRTAEKLHRGGIHVITTEAQTLDQAIAIIKNRKRVEKQKASSNDKPPTLEQELARAKFVSANKSISLSGGVTIKGKGTIHLEKRHAESAKHKRPHPFKDLPDDEKRLKAREMFSSGHWGRGAPAGRRLAITFGVPRETMAEWLKIEI